MNEMSKVYSRMSDDDLRRLKGEKTRKLSKLRTEPLSYFNKRDIQRLEYQLRALTAEQTCRAEQLSLFE